VILLAAKARETRLFALPLVFLWPVFTSVFADDLRLLADTSAYRALWRNGRRLLLLAAALGLAGFISFAVYASATSGVDRYFNVYLFLLLALLSVYGALKGASFTDTNSKNRESI